MKATTPDVTMNVDRTVSIHGCHLLHKQFFCWALSWIDNWSY